VRPVLVDLNLDLDLDLEKIVFGCEDEDRSLPVFAPVCAQRTRTRATRATEQLAVPRVTASESGPFTALVREQPGFSVGVEYKCNNYAQVSL
jgi:hypothetical protein